MRDPLKELDSLERELGMFAIRDPELIEEIRGVVSDLRTMIGDSRDRLPDLVRDVTEKCTQMVRLILSKHFRDD